MIPEVSVVIPAHNRREMSSEAVASVLAQRDVAFELVVVDDGSNDGTAEALEQIARSEGAGRMTVIRTANRGPAAARNRGVAGTRAPMIAFLDSDDLWMPEKLAHQVAAMRANPDCVISQTRELWLRNGKRVNPGRRHRKRAGDLFVDSLNTCLISPSAVILTRGLWETSGGFDEAMAACEDYDLWLRILIDHEVGLVDEPLLTRRAGHAGQLSAIVPALDRYRILALAKLLARADLCASRRRAVAEVLCAKCEVYGNGLVRRGRAADARFYADLAGHAATTWSDRPCSPLEAMISLMRTRLGAVGARERGTEAPETSE